MRQLASDDRIDDLDYPLTTQELCEAAGEVELGIPNCSETLGEAVEALGEQDFHSPADVELAAMNGVGADAVGRRYYSDRDPPGFEDAGYEQVSF